MLVPAICYKDEITEQFAKEVYSDRAFYYIGYGHAHCLPTIEVRDGIYQWAIVNGDKLLGYFAYSIDLETDCVDRFGLYGFDEGTAAERAAVIGSDVADKLDELVTNHHRVSWRVIEGNPVKRVYDCLIDRYSATYSTTVVQLHDVTRDNHGSYCDEFIYEIINPSR